MPDRNDGVTERIQQALASHASTVRPGDRFSDLLDRVAENRPEPAGRFRNVVIASLVTMVIGFLLPVLLPRLLDSPPTAPVIESSSTAPLAPTGPPSLVTLQHSLPIYYVGPNNLLYREFRNLPTQNDRLTTAVAAVLNVVPQDPVDSSLWTGGQVNSAEAVGNRVTIDISGSAFEGFTTREKAQAAINQVVYTALAAVGDQHGEKTVQILKDGSPNLPVIGAPATDFVREQNLPLAPIWIDLPELADPLQAGRVQLSGWLQTSVASPIVTWQVLDADGKVVEKGTATATGDASGWREWKTFTALASGEFTLRVSAQGVTPLERHFVVA